MTEEYKSEERTLHLHGDLLDAIISHVPLIDLLPAYNVSKDWRSAVCSSLSNPSRIKPWFIAHVQSSRNPSLIAIRAYDPETCVWIEIPTPNVPLASMPIKSSHSNLLYMLTPSKLYFSMDPLSTRWHEIIAPKFWRSDPIVAIIGSDIVIAGGTCEFEDDPLSVEIYNGESQRWETCESMPGNFNGSASSTWLSAAVCDRKLFLVEKDSGIFCCFDPKTKTWECLPDLRPNRSIFFSVIGFSENKLILVGLNGDAENVESLRIWEVNCESFYCNEIGEMPAKMLEGLTDDCLSPSSINISMAKNMVYIYNSSEPKQIVTCELSCGLCIWESVQNSVLNDQNLMHKFVFTCWRVGINDLQRAFGKGR